MQHKTQSRKADTASSRLKVGKVRREERNKGKIPKKKREKGRKERTKTPASNQIIRSINASDQCSQDDAGGQDVERLVKVLAPVAPDDANNGKKGDDVLEQPLGQLLAGEVLYEKEKECGEKW